MLNDNLEQQAKLIYDYWFTQFDFPDENGKPYCSSGGKMVWNEQLKRNIPENWNVVPLLKLVSWDTLTSELGGKMICIILRIFKIHQSNRRNRR